MTSPTASSNSERTLYRLDGRRNLHLDLHYGQSAVWHSERRFVFMIAGTQGGKTSFGPWWLAREIQRRGPGDYLAATASYDLFKLKMLPEILRVFVDILRCGRYRASDRVLEIADPVTKEYASPAWARVILRSASAGSGLESSTAKAAWLDECGQDGFTVETWEAILRRLSIHHGRALGTTTPYNQGWLKTQVYRRWAAGDPNYEVVQFSSSANPAFPPDELERARATMPAWRFAMFYQGAFAQPHGLVYDTFDYETHTCDPAAIPTHWRRYVGWDFGGVHTATVWLALDPETHVWHLYRETMQGGGVIAEYAADAKAHAAELPDILHYGGAGSEEQWRRDFAAAGVPIMCPPISSVEAGIDRVTSLLLQKRLIVHRNCSGTLDEMATYRRKLDGEGAPVEEIANQRAYHRLDALRYAVSSMGHHPHVQHGFWS